MTNGVVSVVVNGQVAMKLVAGHDGMNAPKVANAILALGRVPTVEEAEAIAVEHSFGCSDCIVVGTPENPCGRYADDAKEDPQGMARYVDTFNDPLANPRWQHRAEYTEVVTLTAPVSASPPAKS